MFFFMEKQLLFDKNVKFASEAIILMGSSK